MAAIEDGHDCHGRVVLSGSLFVTLLGQGDGRGTMQSPVGPRGLDAVRLTGSNKNNAQGVKFLQGLIACVNTILGLLPVRVELWESSVRGLFGNV